MGGPLLVVVAALTYRRPGMLAQLLESLAGLDHPEGWSVHVLIVDNDAGGSAMPVIDAHRDKFGEFLHYVIEPEPGIPVARNRAMQEAARLGARLLAFIDDDGLADPRWLAELIRHKEATGAVLVGGPYYYLPADQPPASPWKRFLSRSLVARSEWWAARSNADASRVTPTSVSTNNWLADLPWMTDRGIIFDVALKSSGGEDTAFSICVKGFGGKLSRCPSAVVYEHLQRDRLSLRYFTKRWISHAMVNGRLFPQPFRKMAPRQIVRAAIGGFVMVVPVRGVASFTIGAHMVATAIGYFAQEAGWQSRLYDRSK